MLSYGTYFSNNASYSIQYSNTKASKKQRDSHNLIFIIIADVIISDKVQYSRTISKKLPSCYVDNPENPKIFCVPHNQRAIPRYVVCFCSNTA